MTLNRRHVLSGAGGLIRLGVLPGLAFAQDLQTIEEIVTAASPSDG